MAKTKTGVRIDYATNEIVLYKWFAEKARNPKNKEFHTLTTYRRSLPDFSVCVREDIKKNENQEHYKGLTYDYMRDYISTVEPEETRAAVIKELENKILISECHSKRYPTIKNWFLEKYPEVKNFGIKNIVEEVQQVGTMELKKAASM